MSVPIRSAPVSPFAVSRPQVHSRRVSLRVGSFGLTYSTDRLLWDPTAEPSPVGPASAVEPQPQPQQEASTFPLDLEAARKRNLWAAAQEQAAKQQTPEELVVGQQLAGREQVGAESAGQEPSPAPVAASQGRPDPAQSNAAQDGHGQTGQFSGAQADGESAQADQSRSSRSLAQAMRHATRAYLACAASFACPRPMIQAVA
jgi:hypothetical protein